MRIYLLNPPYSSYLYRYNNEAEKMALKTA